MRLFTTVTPRPLLQTIAAALCASLALGSCTSAERLIRIQFAEAIETVLARDSELGAVRNHAPETEPLSYAIRSYVHGLDAIDFSECPAEFTAAFENHRDAWYQSIEFFEQYDAMRGDLHALFETIRDLGGDATTRFERIEEEIWSTWSEVEAAVDLHDARESG